MLDSRPRGRVRPWFSNGRRLLDRRDFLRRSAILGASASPLLHHIAFAGESASSFAQTSTASPDRALDLAEWSYFWVGVEQAHLARGTVVNGKQMYVEYWIPAQVRHPYAMVLVHGGGGQG